MSEEEYYFECELEDSQRNVLIAILAGKKKVSQLAKNKRENLLEALMLCRKKEGPLIRALLDWEEVREKANTEGISEADAMWDLMSKRPITEN